MKFSPWNLRALSVPPWFPALTLAIALGGCGAAETPTETDGGDAAGERGKATYYADSLAGHATASGELYDPGAMTAAHRSLPFGSIVDVIRDDGRMVEVRINDRGPFGDNGAIIDLSRIAADRLGILRAGVVPVTVRVVYLAAVRRR